MYLYDYRRPGCVQEIAGLFIGTDKFIIQIGGRNAGELGVRHRLLPDTPLPYSAAITAGLSWSRY